MLCVTRRRAGFGVPASSALRRLEERADVAPGGEADAEHVRIGRGEHDLVELASRRSRSSGRSASGRACRETDWRHRSAPRPSRRGAIAVSPITSPRCALAAARDEPRLASCRGSPACRAPGWSARSAAASPGRERLTMRPRTSPGDRRAVGPARDRHLQPLHAGHALRSAAPRWRRRCRPARRWPASTSPNARSWPRDRERRGRGWARRATSGRWRCARSTGL